MPYTTVVAGTTITATWSNSNNRDQVITPFGSASARDSAITSPVNGMHCYLTDVDLTMVYDGAQWVRASSNIVARQKLTVGSSTFTTNATTDFVLSGVVVHSTRLYRVCLSTSWLVSAAAHWRFNVHVGGVQTDQITQVQTQAAENGEEMGVILWEPSAGTVTLDVRVVEVAAGGDLSFPASSTEARWFWIEDIGPR